MANKALLKYIQDQIKKGYDTATIKNYLVRYGYNAQDVDETIKEIYSPEVRHIIHFSPTTLISIAAIFIGVMVAVTVFFYFLPSKSPERLLDLNIDTTETTVKAGESITIITDISNIGSDTRFDVNLKYELINQQTNEIFTLKEETIGIETRSSKQTKVLIPSDTKSGNYLLRAIATYDGQRAVATSPVKITDVDETVECENDETFQCDDGSIIVVRACLNNIFIKTGEVCKVVDSCNEDVTEVCGDGSIISTSRCVNGVLEKTSEVCKQEKTG